MKSIDWLNLAKERIECVLHNYPENTYLIDAIKFINEAINEANKLTNKDTVNKKLLVKYPKDIGENLGLSYNDVQLNVHQKREGFK